MLCTLAVNVDAGEFFTVVIINSHLPVAMFPPAIPMETGGIPSFLLAHDIFRPPWLRAILQVRAARASSKLKVDVRYIISRFPNDTQRRDTVGILLDKQENARQQSNVVALLGFRNPIMSHIRAQCSAGGSGSEIRRGNVEIAKARFLKLKNRRTITGLGIDKIA